MKKVGHKKLSFQIKKLTPRGILFGAVLVAVCVWIAFIAGDFLGFGPGRGKEVMVNIPKGATVSEIADILKEEQVIRSPLLFKLHAKMAKNDYVFQQGGHLVGKSMSYRNIAKELSDVPDVSEGETVNVLIPEGYEAVQIAETLESRGLADKERFLELLEKGEFDFDFIHEIDRKENRLEGYLFPATYEIGVWETEWDIINKMLRAFETYVVPIYEEAETKYSLDEVVTFASIVEREAANDSERGKVASVFHNRLEINMALGSCATVQYIIKERKAVLSNADTRIKSPYNTYINPGLPIGPIASPGINSVKAVLYPEDTDYLYFAAKSDGSANVFSKTHSEHLETVRNLQK
ncbi:MAG: endolytic transglycosylase MltG [Clostridia bacterium]|nr:endolytic transglycosylase MltG [Clostridia bacterium]